MDVSVAVVTVNKIFLGSGPHRQYSRNHRRFGLCCKWPSSGCHVYTNLLVISYSVDPTVISSQEYSVCHLQSTTLIIVNNYTNLILKPFIITLL